MGLGRGGVEKSRLKLTSAKVDVEVEAELGNSKTFIIGVKTTANTWATEDDLFKTGQNAPFEACANLENEVDRVDFACYLFNGYIFVEDDSLQYYVLYSRKYCHNPNETSSL